MSGPLFLRVREVAPLLGLSRSKTYELLTRGVIRSVLIDGCRRVPADEVERFAQQLRRDAGMAESAAV